MPELAEPSRRNPCSAGNHPVGWWGEWACAASAPTRRPLEALARRVAGPAVDPRFSRPDGSGAVSSGADPWTAPRLLAWLTFGGTYFAQHAGA